MPSRSMRTPHARFTTSRLYSDWRNPSVSLCGAPRAWMWAMRVAAGAAKSSRRRPLEPPYVWGPEAYSIREPMASLPAIRGEVTRDRTGSCCSICQSIWPVRTLADWLPQ